jgi:hypothetical protein
MLKDRIFPVNCSYEIFLSFSRETYKLEERVKFWNLFPPASMIMNSPIFISCYPGLRSQDGCIFCSCSGSLITSDGHVDAHNPHATHASWSMCALGTPVLIMGPNTDTCFSVIVTSMAF